MFKTQKQESSYRLLHRQVASVCVHMFNVHIKFRLNGLYRHLKLFRISVSSVMSGSRVTARQGLKLWKQITTRFGFRMFFTFTETCFRIDQGDSRGEKEKVSGLLFIYIFICENLFWSTEMSYFFQR